MVGLALLSAVAAAVPPAADRYDDAHYDDDASHFRMLLQLPQLCIARIAIGIAGASINAQAGALFVSLAPSSRRGAYLLIMMIARGVGVAIGGGVGLLVIRLFLTDYTYGAHAAPSAYAHARARASTRVHCRRSVCRPRRRRTGRADPTLLFAPPPGLRVRPRCRSSHRRRRARGALFVRAI